MRSVVLLIMLFLSASLSYASEIRAELTAPEVRTFIEIYLEKDREWVEKAFDRLSLYRNTVLRILKKHQLPEELVVLPVLESGYNGRARSVSGAFGYWQFMWKTAHRYGLGISRWIDERADIEKSTEAAALYIKHLYFMFKDWKLAIAAYNAGEGTILKIMKITGVKDYWKMCRLGLLNRQAREFVPRFMALLWIYNHRDMLGFTEKESPELARVYIPAHIGLKELSEASGVPYKLLKELNPFLKRNITPPWGASVIAPIHYAKRLKEASITVLAMRRARRSGIKLVKGYWRGYLVKRGDSLWRISKATGVPIHLIKFINGIRGNTVQAGDVLLIPRKNLMENIVYFEETKGLLVYRVKKGDTLWKIARIFGINYKNIIRVNGSRSNIRPGKAIRIVLAGIHHENG